MKCFWILNHDMTSAQAEDLKSSFSVDQIIRLPKDISDQWQSLPLDSTVDRNIISSIIEWMKEYKQGDVVVVQGDATYSFTLVDKMLSLDMTVLAAVTERVMTEKMEGDVVVKKSVFKHVCFRPYERF